VITLAFEQDLVPEGERLSEAFVDVVASELGKVDTACPDGVINVKFILEDEMRRLNADYREKNSVTDVLSFAYWSDGLGDGEDLGDVVICYDQAVRQAGGCVRREILMLVVHGILHVFGHDHEVEEEAEVMFGIQDSLVEKLYAIN